MEKKTMEANGYRQMFGLCLTEEINDLGMT